MSREEKRDDPLFNLIEILLARKLIIIFGFISVFTIVLLGALYMPPTYEATSKIYIGSPTIPRVEVPYIREIADRTFVGNQIELIKSRPVLLNVVKKFKMDNTSIPTSGLDNLLYELENKVYSTLKILRNIPDPEERAISTLKILISVRLSRGTDVVTISATTLSPIFSALLTNSVAENYLEFANSLISDRAQSAYRFIEQQIEDARQEHNKALKELNNFKKQENVISIANEINIISVKLAELENAKKQIQIQIENPKKQIDNQELKTLNEQLTILNTQLEQLLIYHTVEHPDVKIMNNRIDKLKNRLSKAKSINEENKNMISVKEKNELELISSDLSEQIKKLLTRRKELAKKQTELEHKTSEYLSSQNKLNMLTNKLENASILKANEMQKGTIRILEKAVPPSFPYTKKKKILFAVGTIAAIVFSFGMALIAEYLDDSIKKPDEVELYLKLPVLGTVPKINRKMRRK